MHTVAVDARTGRELWKTKLGDINRGETITMAPLVVKNKVLVGNSGGELGVRGWLTALDLASDSHFNGPSGFNVTHVVAAGYDSEPQLNDIPDATHVLVLQNRDDVPVLAEAAEHVLTQPIEDVNEIIEGAADFNVGEVLGGLFGAVKHQTAVPSAPLRHVVSHADDVIGDLGHGDLAGAAEDAVLPIPSTECRTESQVDVMFDGGFGDYGHHQDRYVEFVDKTTDPLVLGFFGSLATGAAVSGTAVAVDVSVPGKKKDDAQKT